jgi:hypothetical protein
MTHTKRWLIAFLTQLAIESGAFPPSCASCFPSRHATDAGAPRWSGPASGLDPLQMLGMAAPWAHRRAIRASSRSPFGDYDVDGVTATALLVRCSPLGGNVQPTSPTVSA